MKATPIIVLIVVFGTLLVAILLQTLPPEEPVQVLGDLSKHDIAEIRAGVWRKMYPPIFPDLSIQSLRAFPGLLLQRFKKPKLRISIIEARTYGFVAVLGRPTAGTQKEPCVFWGVFRETNGWQVLTEYRLKRR